MVLCIVALVVFAFLSIFSVKYKPLAAEAFDCSFRKITLRKCNTGFDEKVKSMIIEKLMMRNENAAKFVFKNFHSLSFIFTILFFASMVYSLYGIYNLIIHGTCDPITEKCVFAPLINGTTTGNISGKPQCGLEGFIEFYGEECPHCIKMKPVVEKIETDTGVKFTKLEVTHNKSNWKIMLMYAADIERDCGILGVPAFYSIKTNRAICGEITETQLKQFILQNG